MTLFSFATTREFIDYSQSGPVGTLEPDALKELLEEDTNMRAAAALDYPTTVGIPWEIYQRGKEEIGDTWSRVTLGMGYRAAREHTMQRAMKGLGTTFVLFELKASESRRQPRCVMPIEHMDILMKHVEALVMRGEAAFLAEFPNHEAEARAGAEFIRWKC
jgi:hypothetical protein